MAPPATIDYNIVDGQVVVPATAAKRKGIQPVIALKAKGGKRVEFVAAIDVPPGIGHVVAVERDFEGKADFAVK